MRIPKDLLPGDKLIVRITKRGRKYLTVTVRRSEVWKSHCYNGMIYTEDGHGRQMIYSLDGREMANDTGPVVRVVRVASKKAKPKRDECLVPDCTVKKRDRDAEWLRWIAERCPVVAGPAQQRRLRRIAKRLEGK